jgi:hypothetical protein
MQRVGFLALAFMFSASSAFAGLSLSNGIALNGINLGNGVSMNGFQLGNGIAMNGMVTANGLQLGNGNGTSLVVQSIMLADGTLLSVESAR